MSFFQSVFAFFAGIFNSLEKDWHKLEQPIKNALQWGSSIVNVITTKLDETPQFVLDLIQNAVPGIDIEQVKAAVLEVSKEIAGLEQVPGDDIYATLTNLQDYFSGLEGKKWEQEASIIAQKLASFFAPENTPFATVVTFIEFVYRTIVKK